jgi:hypothetical protein
VSRSRNFQIAASRSERRWHGYTRTIGLKYLKGDFAIGDEDEPETLEFGESQLLFAEGTLSRRRLNDRVQPRRGYVVDFGVRLASEAIVSDTDIAQTWGRLTWLLPQGERNRFKFRAEAGAMTVGNFDALPPDLRFYAGGDRSIRGFDYHAIGETSAVGNVIGGKYLVLGSAEYEYYFNDSWGAAVFSDAGDAFSDDFNLNASVGVGVRWRSPLGPIRVDFAVPVKTELEKSWHIHVLLGPDIRVAGARSSRGPRPCCCSRCCAGGGVSSPGCCSPTPCALGGRHGDRAFRAADAVLEHRGGPSRAISRCAISASKVTHTPRRSGIAHLGVDPTLRMLFSRVLRIERATVRGLTLTPARKGKAGRAREAAVGGAAARGGGARLRAGRRPRDGWP